MRSRTTKYHDEWRIYRRLNGLSDPPRTRYEALTNSEPRTAYIYFRRVLCVITKYVDDLAVSFYDYNEISIRNRNIATSSDDSNSSSDNRDIFNSN